MRVMRALLTFTAVVLGAASAYAESRTFIITNKQKGDPVHACLTTLKGCGVAVANKLCRDRDFKEAANFRKLEGDEVTGAVPTNGSSVGDELFAIECTR